MYLCLFSSICSFLIDKHVIRWILIMWSFENRPSMHWGSRFIHKLIVTCDILLSVVLHNVSTVLNMTSECGQTMNNVAWWGGDAFRWQSYASFKNETLLIFFLKINCNCVNFLKWVLQWIISHILVFRWQIPIVMSN